MTDFFLTTSTIFSILSSLVVQGFQGQRTCARHGAQCRRFAEGGVAVDLAKGNARNWHLNMWSGGTRTTSTEQSLTIYVTNIPDNVTVADVSALFSKDHVHPASRRSERSRKKKNTPNLRTFFDWTESAFHQPLVEIMVHTISGSQ